MKIENINLLSLESGCQMKDGGSWSYHTITFEFEGEFFAADFCAEKAYFQEITEEEFEEFTEAGLTPIDETSPLFDECVAALG